MVRTIISIINLGSNPNASTNFKLKNMKTVKEINDLKNDLLAKYVRHEIEAKELVDKAFEAGYAECYDTYLTSK